MKTIKLTRTIRREVNGVFVYIGPTGIGFRDKHRPKRETFELSWKRMYVQAHLDACAEEERKFKPIVEVKPGPVGDPTQALLFSDFHMGNFVNESPFDEGVNCEDAPAPRTPAYPEVSEPEDCDQEYMEEDVSITS